jgi:hypothetical protein
MIAIQALIDNKNKNFNNNIQIEDNNYPQTKAEKETSEVVNHIIEKIDINNNNIYDIDNNNIITLNNSSIFNKYNKFYMKKKIKEYSIEFGIFALHCTGLMFCRYLSSKICP